MKFPRRMTRVATIVGATALLAANLGASVANANGGGVESPPLPVMITELFLPSVTMLSPEAQVARGWSRISATR
jgi:hypothetical protein